MVATRATCAVWVSGPAQPAFDQVDPARLLRKVDESFPAKVAAASAVACEKGQFERGGFIEDDDVSLPMREVVPSTERITGGISPQVQEIATHIAVTHVKIAP